jgi:glutamate/tyrosine decarboxylase-like PLP-dependent enzyme
MRLVKALRGLLVWIPGSLFKSIIGGEGMAKIASHIASFFLKSIRSIPAVKRRVQSEYEGILKGLEGILKPYTASCPSCTRLPENGLSREAILKSMKALSSKEENKWKEGYVSGAVYHGDDEHIRFLNEVYSINSQSNPLHPDIWPSSVKYEAEIVSMVSRMLGAETVKDGEVCGCVTSGGTESILLAMKAYRDWAKETRGIKKPEMVVPLTAHAAFQKAAEYFNIKFVGVPVGDGFGADVKRMKKAVTDNTIVVVGSAPSFPHGIIDPIEELSEIARKRGAGFHTDACLGGFILPWAEKLGYRVPPFDFRLPGVTSVSVDTHKYGYAAKGTSVILYRNRELRHFQYFRTTDWPGGLYFSPTFAGSRPGALVAACWAAMLSIGEKGYLQATEKILETASKIKKGINSIEELNLLGDPLFVIAFNSKTLDIYRVLDYMSGKGWSLNALHKPPALHLCVTLRHTSSGVAERFIDDLKAAVQHVKDNPEEKGGMAPVYGMASTIPDRSMVAELLDMLMDMLYRV